MSSPRPDPVTASNETLRALQQAVHDKVQTLHEQAKVAARHLAKQEQALERLSPEEKEKALQALHRASRYAHYAWASGLIVMTAIAVTFFVAAISPGAAVILGTITVGTSLPLPWMLGQAFRRRLREEKLIMHIQGEVQTEMNEHVASEVLPSKSVIEAIAAVREAQHALTEAVQRLTLAQEASKKIKKLAKKAQRVLDIAKETEKAGNEKTVQDAIRTAQRLIERIGRVKELPEELKKPISDWFIVFSVISLIVFLTLAGLVVGSPAAPALVPVCLVVGLGVRFFLLGAVLYENNRQDREKASLPPSSPVLAGGSAPCSTYAWLRNTLGFSKNNASAPQVRSGADLASQQDARPANAAHIATVEGTENTCSLT